MRWPWWDRRRPSIKRPVLNPRRQELETAKEILAEVFGARPSDVEEILSRRRSGDGASKVAAFKFCYCRYLEFSIVAPPHHLHLYTSIC
jgi:hypothetical protein